MQSLPARTATRRESPFALHPASKKKITNAPSRYGHMRKCEGMSKAAIKAKRAHAEI
jgi:hypothetical protein